MDYNNIDSLIEALVSLLDVPKPPDLPIPTPLVMLSGSRPGISAQKVAANVIKRRAEAGLPVGNLPDGSVNPAEMMEIIRVQEVFNELIASGRLTVVIPPGVPIYGTGATNTGVVYVQGITTAPAVGHGIIQ